MLPFADYSNKVLQHIESHYGIRVITRDVTDPLIGDLDGVEIHIDHAVTAEERLFLLAHLFGHTVQWNAYPETVELGRPHQPPVPETAIPALLDYLQGEGGTLARLTTRQASLEDVFVTLTGRHLRDEATA